MKMTSVLVLLSLFFLVALPVAGIFLQLFLSRCEAAWPGLVLPVLSGLTSLLYPLSFAVMPGEDMGGVLLNVAIIFLIANIPTAVLVAIYVTVRGKRRRKRQLEKMQIQDLEG